MKHEHINGAISGAGLLTTFLSRFIDEITPFMGLIGAFVAIWAGVSTILKNKKETKAHDEAINTEKLQQQLAQIQLDRLEDNEQESK